MKTKLDFKRMADVLAEIAIFELSPVISVKESLLKSAYKRLTEVFADHLELDFYQDSQGNISREEGSEQ